jgi:hypothetical protein
MVKTIIFGVELKIEEDFMKPIEPFTETLVLLMGEDFFDAVKKEDEHSIAHIITKTYQESGMDIPTPSSFISFDTLMTLSGYHLIESLSSESGLNKLPPQIRDLNITKRIYVLFDQLCFEWVDKKLGKEKGLRIRAFHYTHMCFPKPK